MDGLQGSVSESGPSMAAIFPALVAVETVRTLGEGLTARRLDDLDTLVVTKTAAGFDAAGVEALTRLLDGAVGGHLGRLKFLAFDFAHDTEGPSAGAEGFHGLVNTVANLILRAPIVSVACARGHMEGADLEFALACSMLVGERGAGFSFADDPAVALDTYGFLSQKLGFVRAERLMERGERLDADQMHELLLLKNVAEAGSGLDGLQQFLRRTARRHNACYGIYRAQRIAAPAIDQSHAYGAFG